MSNKLCPIDSTPANQFSPPMPTSIAPILIVAFNRPDFCEEVIKAVRLAKPQHLFLAVDGPRAESPSDEINCAKTKATVKLIDWPCEVRTFFRETNRSCKYAPPEAITWFFSQVPAGIILEDDCVPTLDFLLFASQLLQRYSDEETIGMITGNNHFGFQSTAKESYHFSAYSTIWGWASWRRAWELYDVDMKPYICDLASIRARAGHSERFRAYWWRYVEAVLNGMNTWDVQWSVALLANRKLIIRPKCNLVANIGFTPDSTHTSGYEYGAERYVRTGRLDFPLVHPIDRKIDDLADLKLEKSVVSYWRRGLTFIGSRCGLVGRLIASIAAGIEKTTALRSVF